MEQDDLKELAEWYGCTFDKYNWGDSYKPPLYFPKGSGIRWLKFENWQPDKDSNQLDMLEDKMIKEAQIIMIHFNVQDFVIGYYGLFNSALLNEADGKGKTKNEARLNAILNYIKSLKEK